MQTPPFTWKRLTDANGNTELANLVPGPHILECWLDGYQAETNVEDIPGIRLLVADVVASERNELLVTMHPIETNEPPSSYLPVDEKGLSQLDLHLFNDSGKPLTGASIAIRQQTLATADPTPWPTDWPLSITEIDAGEFVIQFSVPPNSSGSLRSDGVLWIDVLMNDQLIAKSQSIKLRNPQVVQISFVK